MKYYLEALLGAIAMLAMTFALIVGFAVLGTFL